MNQNNHVMAAKFFLDLYGTSNPLITIQAHYEYNKDTKKEEFEEEKKSHNAQIFHGHYSELIERIDRLTAQGYGIFFLVNPSNEASTLKSSIKHSSHFFIDIDDGELPEFAIQPTVITERGDNNFHCFWELSEKITDCAKWEAIQSAIINYYKADKACKNFNRVLRIPGTIHQKSGLVTSSYFIRSSGGTVSSLEGIKSAHNITDSILKKNKGSNTEVNFNLLSSNIKNQIDIRAGGKIGMGERNPILFKICAYLKDQLGEKKEVQKYMAYASSLCEVPLSDHEIDTIFNNVYKYTENTVNMLAGELKENWVYVTSQDKYINKKKPRIDYIEKAFNKMLLSRGYFNASIAAHYGFIQEVDNRGYLPCGGEVYDYEGEDRYNMYIAPNIKAIEEEPTWFLDLMQHIFQDDGEREHALNYFAHLVQKPREKIAHGIILQSETQGIGKTLLFKILSLCVGESNCAMPTNKQVNDQFNTWLEGKVLVYIDEIDQGHKSEFYNEMKSYITDNKVSIRRMRTDPYIVGNYANFFCTTNNDHMIRLDNKDRRWFIVKSKAHKMTPEEIEVFFQPKWDKIKNREVGDVYNFLLTRDLTGFNASKPAPMTTAKQEVIDSSKSKLEEWVEDCVEDMEFPFDKPLITIPRDIMPNIPSYISSRFVSSNAIAAVLKECGCLKERMKIDKKARKFWVLIPEEWTTMPILKKQELYKEYILREKADENEPFH